MTIHDSILSTIGNTPVVKVNRQGSCARKADYRALRNEPAERLLVGDKGEYEFDAGSTATAALLSHRLPRRWAADGRDFPIGSTISTPESCPPN